MHCPSFLTNSPLLTQSPLKSLIFLSFTSLNNQPCHSLFEGGIIGEIKCLNSAFYITWPPSSFPIESNYYKLKQSFHNNFQMNDIKITCAIDAPEIFAYWPDMPCTD